MHGHQPLRIHLDSSVRPVVAINAPWPGSASSVNELLNANHDLNHAFFTREEDIGVYMHNHLVHHALTLYALGAPSGVIVTNHTRNQLYQRDSPRAIQAAVRDLDDHGHFLSCLGKDEQYSNFLRFFEKQIGSLGSAKFFEKFVFSHTQMANDMIARLFAGFLHPILGVGFAIEFQQPAVLAEAFAQACVHHDDHLEPFFRATESRVKSGQGRSAFLVDIIEKASQSAIARSAADIKFFRQFNDKGEMRAKLDHVRDGVLAVAGPTVVELCAQWQVKPDEVERKTAELINTAGESNRTRGYEHWLTQAAYVVCAAQRRPYECRFDFFTLHGLTTSLFYSCFLREPAIPPEHHARLLEYLGRMIIVLYIGAGSPSFDLQWALSHPPKVSGSTWESISERAWVQKDDGHMCKFIRSLKNAENVSKPYDARPEFRLKQQMFLPLANAVIDCGSQEPMRGGLPLDWIRCPGLDEAWEKVPNRVEYATSAHVSF